MVNKLENEATPVVAAGANPVSEITVVNFLGRDIHVLGTPENPLFIAKDVAEWIGLSNVSVMCKTLEEHDIRKVYIISAYGLDGATQTKEVLAITEQGLYKILWRSNKPEAQKFASKCADIIKEIRLKGSYSVAQPSYQIEDSIERAKAWIKEEEQRRLLTVENKKLTTKIEEDAPKVECWDKFVGESNELISITDFAKVLHNKWSDITPHRLFAILREAKILQDGYFNKNIPYQHYIKEGYFKVKEKPSVNKAGLNFISRQTLVTPKGQKYLIGKFLSARASDEENDIDMFE